LGRGKNFWKRGEAPLGLPIDVLRGFAHLELPISIFGAMPLLNTPYEGGETATEI